MARKIFGVIGGLALAFLLIMVLKMVSSYFFAPPALDPSDPEAAKEIIRRMSPIGFLSVLAIYFVSTFVGGFTAAKISRQAWAAWVVAAFILVAAIADVVRLPHPIWFTVLAVALIGAAGWLGGRSAPSAWTGTGSDDGLRYYGGDTGRDHDGSGEGGD